MAKQAKKPKSRTEPAHSLLYQPSQLLPITSPPDTKAILQKVQLSKENPLNQRQQEAFVNSFTKRLSLLWGPPGTGKSSVLADIVLGWLEKSSANNTPLCIVIGSSNWDAIDNLLKKIADRLTQHREKVGEFSIPANLIRVRGDHSRLLNDSRITDLSRTSDEAWALAEAMNSPTQLFIVGSTWQQLGKLAKQISQDEKPVAQWFDLLLIDEASQVPVQYAAAYFLLLRETANVVIAGDNKQLGPVYGFQIQNEHNEQGLFDCIFTYMQESFCMSNSDVVALNKNYRNNNEISGWARERLYKEGGYEALYPRCRLNLTLPSYGEIQPSNWPTQLPWSKKLLRILDPNLPVVVITYEAQTYTVSNSFEAQIVAALSYLYYRILEENQAFDGYETFWKENLGIITPHRAQVANLRNLLIDAAGIPQDPAPAISTVDSFQGQERDLIIASYTVADRDFVGMEDEFILNPRRFNVTQTRPKSKFVMLVSNAIVQHLPSDAQVAKAAAHLQLFVLDYCSSLEKIVLPTFEHGTWIQKECWLRGRGE